MRRYQWQRQSYDQENRQNVDPRGPRGQGPGNNFGKKLDTNTVDRLGISFSLPRLIGDLGRQYSGRIDATWNIEQA